MRVSEMWPAQPVVKRGVRRTSTISGLVAALLVGTALTAPAFAGGGRSGTFQPDGGGAWGAAGGDDEWTASGWDGEDGPDCCGGGGGGAGVAGGAGGSSSRGGVQGGRGGVAPGESGWQGATDVQGSGSGGGGGAHGFVGSAFPTYAVRGGDGGDGGAAFAGSNPYNPTAGGGGAGGYGAVVVGGDAYTAGTLSVSVTGGNGGNGGNGYASQSLSGGSGGSGGIGLVFQTTAEEVTRFAINGAVTGGRGGAGGAFGGNGGNGGVGLSLLNVLGTGGTWLTINGAVTGGQGGAAGAGGLAGSGGAGLVGAEALIVMGRNGSIAGGFNALGQQANAIEFVGSSNILEFSGPTSQLSGNILNQGTLYLFSKVSTEINNAITGSGDLRTDIGTITLSGINTYTGFTSVDGGTLNVEGALTGTSSVTVYSGATLGGSGVITTPLVTIERGGTFAPGNGTPGSSTGIVGDLAFQSGATYLVQVNPATASFASVTGAATLGGATVNAVFAGGSYISKTYTILTATGGVSGTFAPNVVNTNLPANFHTGLSYDANNAYLNLVLDYTPPPPPTSPDFGRGLSGNQQAVAGALVNSFNANGGIPLVYGLLTQAGLTQASGELGTSSQQTTFQAMGQFMGMLTGPAGGCVSQVQGGDECLNTASGSGVLGYADQRSGASTASKRAGDAFAMFTKAPVATSADPRWSTWVMGFGGSQTTDGNAAVGSNSATSSLYGTAVGADYRLSPNTIAGFALAGGGTNFSVGNGGSGRSDLFQAGAYVRHNIGAAYLSAALGYGWQDITTDRSVMADRLRASFNANAWSGRAEGGYRLIAPWVGGIGITPYAAVQVTTFDLPAYAEQVLSGSSAFALNYAGKSITDTRTELGLRTDKSFVVQDGILTLRSRFAWAHDYNSDRSVAATFQALPGASFVVNGAAQARDAALTTASAEMKWRNGWSAAATFEGEFSNVTRSYGGRGVVRYSW